MSRLGQVVSKTLAIVVALFFLLGAIVTAVPTLFGGSKVRTLFEGSRDALAGDSSPVRARDAGTPDTGAPAVVERDRHFMYASKAGPMPVPPPEPAQPDQPTHAVDAGKPDAGRERAFFPASKSAGGMLFNDNPAQQVDP